jgi:hypothetical protein
MRTKCFWKIGLPSLAIGTFFCRRTRAPAEGLSFPSCRCPVQDDLQRKLDSLLRSGAIASLESLSMTRDFLKEKHMGGEEHSSFWHLSCLRQRRKNKRTVDALRAGISSTDNHLFAWKEGFCPEGHKAPEARLRTRARGGRPEAGRRACGSPTSEVGLDRCCAAKITGYHQQRPSWRPAAPVPGTHSQMERAAEVASDQALVAVGGAPGPVRPRWRYRGRRVSCGRRSVGTETD